MKVPSAIALAVFLSVPSVSRAQDVLAEHKIRGLKRLSTMAIVIRANDLGQVATVKEWGDMAELRLHRDIPELKFMASDKTPNWLEISVITTDSGGVFEVSLYRWVRVLDSGEETVSKVWWDSRAVFGGISKQAGRESLETLLTSFAADYVRAKQ